MRRQRRSQLPDGCHRNGQIAAKTAKVLLARTHRGTIRPRWPGSFGRPCGTKKQSMTERHAVWRCLFVCWESVLVGDRSVPLKRLTIDCPQNGLECHPSRNRVPSQESCVQPGKVRTMKEVYKLSVAMLILALGPVAWADYAETVLQDSPVAYYRFEEPEGFRRDR